MIGMFTAFTQAISSRSLDSAAVLPKSICLTARHDVDPIFNMYTTARQHNLKHLHCVSVRISNACRSSQLTSGSSGERLSVLNIGGPFNGSTVKRLATNSSNFQPSIMYGVQCDM